MEALETVDVNPAQVSPLNLPQLRSDHPSQLVAPTAQFDATFHKPDCPLLHNPLRPTLYATSQSAVLPLQFFASNHVVSPDISKQRINDSTGGKTSLFPTALIEQSTPPCQHAFIRHVLISGVCSQGAWWKDGFSWVNDPSAVRRKIATPTCTDASPQTEGKAQTTDVKLETELKLEISGLGKTNSMMAPRITLKTHRFEFLPSKDGKSSLQRSITLPSRISGSLAPVVINHTSPVPVKPIGSKSSKQKGPHKKTTKTSGMKRERRLSSSTKSRTSKSSFALFGEERLKIAMVRRCSGKLTKTKWVPNSSTLSIHE